MQFFSGANAPVIETNYIRCPGICKHKHGCLIDADRRSEGRRRRFEDQLEDGFVGRRPLTHDVGDHPIPAVVQGIDAKALNTKMIAGHDRPRQMITLADQHGLVDTKDGMRPVATVVGVKAGIIECDVIGFDAQLFGQLTHGHWLVVEPGTVVTGHKQLVNPAGFV